MNILLSLILLIYGFPTAALISAAVSANTLRPSDSLLSILCNLNMEKHRLRQHLPRFRTKEFLKKRKYALDGILTPFPKHIQTQNYFCEIEKKSKIFFGKNSRIHTCIFYTVSPVFRSASPFYFLSHWKITTPAMAMAIPTNFCTDQSAFSDPNSPNSCCPPSSRAASASTCRTRGHARWRSRTGDKCWTSSRATA